MHIKSRSSLIVAAGLLMFASTSLVGVARAGEQDFKLVNKTGYQIDSVYVGASSSKSWGNDIMGRDALADGETVNITFPHTTSACSFDIKVKYNDGDTAEWSQVDLCKWEKISLFWDCKVTRAVGE
jgi:hypothetical protein